MKSIILSNNYSYGKSSTISQTNDISMNQSIEVSAEKLYQKSEAKNIVKLLNFIFQDNSCYNLIAVPLFRSEVNICEKYIFKKYVIYADQNDDVNNNSKFSGYRNVLDRLSLILDYKTTTATTTSTTIITTTITTSTIENTNKSINKYSSTSSSNLIVSKATESLSSLLFSSIYSTTSNGPTIDYC
ncbi:hypothetical protein BCR36DRAFT_369398 [Piromyces finnis]|uniref:Uncharacterized protein n=1 Tax=Piromyces finnis TaxID=1754191 RepID=A0A1Y1VCB2_9FUNG|nr:hypothetical protein BCR36DRAFT_369398 [Piromyces finnis]|eukprot:ORX52603.1 hypothetical protein BCR36DRAFT_369398 [Piromyces finnis]